MAWLVLIISGICESVWAIALDKTQGFTKLVPSVIFVFGLAASMAGLAYAMRSISAGTAYSVWVGIGAAITVIYGMVMGTESVSIMKCACLILLLSSIVGLKLAS